MPCPCHHRLVTRASSLAPCARVHRRALIVSLAGARLPHLIISDRRSSTASSRASFVPSPHGRASSLWLAARPSSSPKCLILVITALSLARRPRLHALHRRVLIVSLAGARHAPSASPPCHPHSSPRQPRLRAILTRHPASLTSSSSRPAGLAAVVHACRMSASSPSSSSVISGGYNVYMCIYVCDITMIMLYIYVSD